MVLYEELEYRMQGLSEGIGTRIAVMRFHTMKIKSRFDQFRKDS